ncbi:MAG: hypothetical protein WCT19_00705 [Candidatus Paceibacterota bacterium]|jgi:hypothetical protein
MSFEKAKQYARGLNSNSSEEKSTFAVVEAMESVAETVDNARSVIKEVGENLDNNLRQLKESGNDMTYNLHFLMLEIRSLNTNLKRFDDGATKLGKTANILTIGLLVFAGISAFASIVQAGLIKVFTITPIFTGDSASTILRFLLLGTILFAYNKPIASELARLFLAPFRWLFGEKQWIIKAHQWLIICFRFGMYSGSIVSLFIIILEIGYIFKIFS